MEGATGTISTSPGPASMIEGKPIDPAARPPSEGERLRAEEETFGEGFRRQRPVVWWATLVGPLAATAGVLLALGLTRGYDFVLKLVGTAIGTFFGLGRFVILLGSDQPARHAALSPEHAGEAARYKFMTSVELFAMVTWMDVLAATLLIFHAGFLYRIPWLGPRMLALHGDGQFFLRYQPWIRRFTFVGLAMFVMIPVAATGSVGGAILGRLLGMTRRASLLAILCGTLAGNAMMFSLGRAIRRIPFLDPHNPWNYAAGLGIIVLVIALLNGRYRSLKRRLLAEGIVPPGSTGGKPG